MSLAFKPVKQQTRRAKVLLIGEPGVGKSHAALTFPNPALIDAEGSADWFADRFQFLAVPTKSYREVRELVKSVREGKVKCDTLIIDSLTSIYNSLVNEATVERQTKSSSNPYPSDDLRPLDWGRIKRKFSSLLDELYHKLPCNVVCVGWIKAEYAKAGDVVDGKTVKPNDLVKVGEQFDGDRKTMYAFDFVIKVLGNNGKKARAQVIKSRAGGLKSGQVIEDFSYKTIADLMPQGEGDYQGMSDEEAQERDRGILDDSGPASTTQSRAPSQPSPVTVDHPEALSKDQATVAAMPAEEVREKIEELLSQIPEQRRIKVIGDATDGKAYALDQIKTLNQAKAVLVALLHACEVFDDERVSGADAHLFGNTHDGTDIETELPL